MTEQQHVSLGIVSFDTLRRNFPKWPDLGRPEVVSVLSDLLPFEVNLLTDVEITYSSADAEPIAGLGINGFIAWIS